VTLTVGVDVGGTKLAAGVVDADGRVIERTEIPTPTSDSAELLAAITDTARGFLDAHAATAVGVGVAGLVDREGEIVRSASHLSLRDFPLRKAVSAAVGVPVVVDNDANAAGWAESRFGSAHGCSDALFVGVGTGIGGALVIGGQLRRGAHGTGGEIGHVVVERDGRPCPCGSRGCWEQYGSGRAFLRTAREAGFEVEHGAAVTAAAQDGDSKAIQVFDEIGTWLGLGIAGLVAVLDPEVVVVGGGLSRAGDLLLVPTRRAFEDYLTARGRHPEPRLVLAGLGPDAGLIGAADLARGQGTLGSVRPQS
jgi:glucokinase